MRINSWIQVLWRTCEDEEHRVVLCCCLIALDCNVCRRVCSLTRPGRSWNRLIIPTWLPAVSVNQQRWPMVSSCESACVDTRNQRWAVNHPEMRSQFVFYLIQLKIDPEVWICGNISTLAVCSSSRRLVSHAQSLRRCVMFCMMSSVTCIQQQEVDVVKSHWCCWRHCNPGNKPLFNQSFSHLKFLICIFN